MTNYLICASNYSVLSRFDPIHHHSPFTLEVIGLILYQANNSFHVSLPASLSAEIFRTFWYLNKPFQGH
ncbi:hypothetical protein ACFCVU_04025 [Peribacillus butanolivorans]|uniref:hypothetical protein n=1 Tax=Peribacillus butanolivorans TaxID=421767 RepID=UPI001145645A|nr:hypothetical protein [Peribacillus butanolivorans]